MEQSTFQQMYDYCPEVLLGKNTNWCIRATLRLG